MHLAEMALLRTMPAAAVFLAVTRRCPLSCAHCSTDSASDSEQYPAAPFLNLVSSFTTDDHPQVIAMSGGEALLRAPLVRDLATAARQAGVRSYLLSGMYFARGGRKLPSRLLSAIASVDHFAASLDQFHEREVGRVDVFRALHRIRECGPDISLQLTGLGDEDPYLADLVADIRREFADEVPILVGHVRALGRARQWLPEAEAGAPPGPPPAPCDVAAWPLVTYDGTVFACCNQNLLEASRPPHLIIGHAAHDPWPQLRDRFLSRHVLRAIRIFGPRYTQDRFGDRPAGPGYCATCVGLHHDTALTGNVTGYLNSCDGHRFELAIRQVVEHPRAQDFIGRAGSQRYRELVTLGWSQRIAGPEEARCNG